MHASNQNCMKVLQQSLVSPSPASLDHSAPATLPLTFFDIVWLPTGSVEPLYLYEFPHPTAVFMEAHLPRLKSSLSHTLRHFYPLAGRLRLSRAADHPTDRQYEIRYVDGDSVPFTVVESTDLDFLDIVGSHPRRSSKLQSLVPRLPDRLEDDVSTPLLAIQVTVFPNRGIGIGYSLHQIACDAFSSMHFLDSWATSCRSSSYGTNAALVVDAPPPPSFDRSAIVDPCNLYSEYLSDVLSFKNVHGPTTLKDDGPQSADSAVVTASFTLGSSQVEWIKTTLLVRSKCSTTFVVSTAYVWVCLAKTGVWPADRSSAHFMFLADWRKRLGGGLDWYFGNCVGVCFAEAEVSDLVKPGADGVTTACVAIGSAIEELKEGFTKNMVGKNKKVYSILACRPLTVAGTPRFKAYDIDFGWGRPTKFEMTSLGAGAMSMTESREEQGGVEIGVALPKDGMEAFMVHFEEGLK